MRRNRNCALATSLPDSIIPVKNLAATYLKMYIALEAAWTKYTSMSHSRLLDRHDVIEKVIMSVREHKNKDGRCPPEVKEAFEELSLSGPEADSLQKTLTEVVSSSQH